MKRLVLKHRRDYYLGLALLVASCLTLVWALWRDAFRPSVFLGGFLLFSWGYALLWRNDMEDRLAEMNAEIADLKTQLIAPDKDAVPVVWAQELHAMEPVEDAGETPVEGESLLPNEF